VTRPPCEVADIIRQHGDRFIETHSAWLTTQHRRVLRALARCRTAALGGHLDRCVACDHRAISYNSCRNRHCPKCLTQARDQWIAARHDELLPVGYHHVVFTLPFLASRRRARDLARCRHALSSRQPRATSTVEQATPVTAWPCPRCGGTMMIIERLTMYQIRARALAMGIFVDTS
jgi:predicted RNA-binding Zn-ribbon protein involved in translation (DUF1610 family)